MSEAKTIKLKNPIDQGHGLPNISEITLKPIKARHMRSFPVDMSKMTFDHILVLVGKVSGLTDDLIDELSMDDMTEVAEAITNFLPPGRLTGGTGSV